MKKRPAILSYRMRISIAIALFAIIPFLVVVVGYVHVEESNLVNSALSQHVQMLEMYNEQLSRGFQEVESKALYVKNNKKIRNYLNRMQMLDMPGKLQFVSELQEIHNAISVDNNELTLHLYSDYSDYSYGGYCYTKDDLAASFEGKTQYLKQIHELGTNETLMLIRETEVGLGKHIVSVYTKIDNIIGTDHILEVSMPIAVMVYSTNAELPKNYLIGAYFAQNGDPQTVVLQENLMDAQAFLEEYYKTGICSGYFSLEISSTAQSECLITLLLDEAYVVKLLWNNWMHLVMLTFALIVMVLICSYITSRLLTKKVIQFIAHIDDELGHKITEENAVSKATEDFSDIAQRVRELAARSREQGQQLETHKLEKKQMELELLQMRFNPHFLYNTLGSIRYQIKDKRIIKSIDSLIAYYRIVLSKGSLLISVESEIQMIREYLNLQTFAFNLQNITYSYEIEDGVKQFTIIKHLLQPIVENALDHGVRGSQESATIYIRARLEDKNVVFEVEDTGVGMTPEQIVQITTAPSSSLLTGGYGVYNVIQRIKTYYGPEYGIEFFSEQGKGTLARITIPQKSASELH